MTFILRAATVDDREPVLDLLEELFDPPASRPADYARSRAEEGFAHAVAHPEAEILLAIDTGQLVGLASVYSDFPSMRFGQRCWLEDLVVTASRRGAGVGALLLHAATDWGRQRGCTHLELDSAHARPDAHRFYLARGMAQDSVVFGLAIRDADV
jgi:GNAT superfamily N-acetyltransferase